MKLYTALLEKFIDLPSTSPLALRPLLDDLGLEVKDIESHSTGDVYTIETLANRGDHLSAIGVAREISARLLTGVKTPSMAELPDRKISVPVKISSPLCMQLGLLEMIVPFNLPLRDEIAATINFEGPKHPIVSVLNYVALELGQPMHAFDRDKIEGEVEICVLEKEEEIEALNGKKYIVPVGALVHRDRKKILDVAGVIGCANSMATESTTRVLIEAASFDPISVRLTARKMGISTDASYTFERGCDRGMVIPALKRVLYLLQNSNSSQAQDLGTSFTKNEDLPPRKVTLSLPKLKKQLNLSTRIQTIEITTRLKNLGFLVDVVEADKVLSLTVPTWRLWDVVNEEDLIEDFARSFSLNNIKPALPPLDYAQAPLNFIEQARAHLEPVMIGNGFVEVISKSFYSPDDVTLLESLSPDFGAQQISMKNSLESSYAYLKQSNILQGALIAAGNLRRGVSSVKTFDVTTLFSSNLKPGIREIEDKKAETGAQETSIVSFCVAGRWSDQGDWKKGESTEELFFKLKGVLESVAQASGFELSFVKGSNPFLHPGMQASLVSKRETVGCIGVVHPSIKGHVESPGDIIYAELDLKTLAKENEKNPYKEPVDFPMIKRDLTLRLPIQKFAGDVVKRIEMQKIPEIISVTLVDDFKKDEEDFRRVSFRITFQNAERTLAHSEVDGWIAQILEALKEKEKVLLV